MGFHIYTHRVGAEKVKKLYPKAKGRWALLLQDPRLAKAEFCGEGRGLNMTSPTVRVK